MEGLEFVDRETYSNLLSDGLSICNAFDSVNYAEEDYQKAKKQVTKLFKEHDFNVCLEDVFVQMLVNGDNFEIVDVEGEAHALTLENLIEGSDLFFKSCEGDEDGFKDFNDIAKYGDAMDSEAILQFAIFGEVIYG